MKLYQRKERNETMYHIMLEIQVINIIRQQQNPSTEMTEIKYWKIIFILFSKKNSIELLHLSHGNKIEENNLNFDTDQAIYASTR